MALHVARSRIAACSSTDMSQGRTRSNKRLRLRSRSSPPDEDRRRSPLRNRRRPARLHSPARRLLPVPPAHPRSLVLGYSPALGEVGTLVPALLPVFPTAPGLRPRRLRPAATVERARPGRPPRRLPGLPPGPPTSRHSTEAGRRATPALPRAPKQSRWNNQLPRSWPIRLGVASSPRRARFQSSSEPDAPHTISLV